MNYESVMNEMKIPAGAISREEFEELKKYTERKAKLNKKPDWYVELLLPDVIRERLFNRALNNLQIRRA